jgi:hypothetical protein
LSGKKCRGKKPRLFEMASSRVGCVVEACLLPA